MLGLGNHHRVDLHFIGRQKALDESGLSVNGIGIRVGVLSDSFNDLGGAAADEADGALPPAAETSMSSRTSLRAAPTRGAR